MENAGQNKCQCCHCDIPPGQSKCDHCKECKHRMVGFPLGLGILIFPLIFAWFTLRHGYSTTARVVSFVWLILCLSGALLSQQHVNFYAMVMNNGMPEQVMMQSGQGHMMEHGSSTTTTH